MYSQPFGLTKTLFFGVKSGCEADPHLVPRWRLCGALPPLPLAKGKFYILFLWLVWNTRLEHETSTYFQAVVHRDSSGSADSGCSVSSSTGQSYAASPRTSPSHGTVCLQIKEDKNYELLSTEEAGSCSSLDEFRSRQKFMEEQNRQRKELLAKALADRSVWNHCLQHKNSLNLIATKNNWKFNSILSWRFNR